jgi:hypothetical protein
MTMKLRFSLSILYLTAAWLIVVATLAGIVYGLMHNTFDGLAEYAPGLEFKQGVIIQTIEGQRFVRETRADGSTHLVPLK